MVFSILKGESLKEIDKTLEIFAYILVMLLFLYNIEVQTIDSHQQLQKFYNLFLRFNDSDVYFRAPRTLLL